MHDVALVMPMAGEGTRFQRRGILTPKPLVELWGRPLFWWAAESVLRAVPVRELIFVVLAQHIERFGIDVTIRALYPNARIVAVPDVTSGAAETAAIGAAALETSGPIALNDCDHAFLADGMQATVEQLHGRSEGALLGFRSQAPGYSYVMFDGQGKVVGTVEKQVASDFAIAGCYLFADPRTFLDRFAAYRRTCAYHELFISGVYNVIVQAGGEVRFSELTRHVSFGTPEERDRVAPEHLLFLEADAR
jgi:dTDP-glucose pyrophosphorylase